MRGSLTVAALGAAGLAIALSIPIIGMASSNNDRQIKPQPQQQPGPVADRMNSSDHTYTVQEIRSLSIFGARLSMRLEDARAALAAHGLKRMPFSPARRITGEPQVLEADYIHPIKNTKVGIFYTELRRGIRVVSRIVLWEEILTINREDFDRFIFNRYGQATVKENFHRHDIYIWSQRMIDYNIVLRSMQCMMPCITDDTAKECSAQTISRQVLMSGGFNTNMPGKLYWTADLNDLEIQRTVALRDKSYPKNRPICPVPVF